MTCVFGDGEVRATLQRTILHVDFNNFYASVEELYRPELRGRPMIVTGDPDLRHGIVLSKNNAAKALGIKTAETVREARDKCPTVVEVVADMNRYYRFADGLLDLCASYTDLVQSGGDDEAYLDISGSLIGKGGGRAIADEIRRRSVEEYGVTCSVGVSFCKVFAKLGSDYKKPDATTVISQSGFRDIVWPMPASALLGVGRATQIRLFRYGILTVGDIAAAERATMGAILGRNGDALWRAANGLEDDPVAPIGQAEPIRSVGNSTTCPRDIHTREEARVTFYMLAENVGARLRERGLKANTVHAAIRGVDLRWSARQVTLESPTQLTGELTAAAMGIFDACYRPGEAMRGLALHCSGLVDAQNNVQLSFFRDERRERTLRLENAKDALRRRFGEGSIVRGMMLQYPDLAATRFREDRRSAAERFDQGVQP